MSVHLRWLVLESIKKNFDIRETLILVAPSTIAYFETLEKIKALPINLVIITSILIFLLLLAFQLYKNFKKNEKAVAEVLETGYFNNFFTPFATVITSKLQEGRKITFDFKNKTLPSVETDNVELRIIIPESKDKLDNVMMAIDGIAKDACIDNSTWIKAQVLADDKVIIYECPRTLTAIEKHLINGETGYTNKESIKFHEYFYDKFMKDYELAKFKFSVSKIV